MFCVRSTIPAHDLDPALRSRPHPPQVAGTFPLPELPRVSEPLDTAAPDGRSAGGCLLGRRTMPVPGSPSAHDPAPERALAADGLSTVPHASAPARGTPGSPHSSPRPTARSAPPPGVAASEPTQGPAHQWCADSSRWRTAARSPPSPPRSRARAPTNRAPDPTAHARGRNLADDVRTMLNG